MATFFRLVLLSAVVGALIGVVASSLAAPSYIAWDNTTDGADGMCLCRDKARQTAERVIHLQLLWGASGAGTGVLAACAIGLMRRKKKSAAEATFPPREGPKS
jgi:hypothetical protein